LKADKEIIKLKMIFFRFVLIIRAGMFLINRQVFLIKEQFRKVLIDAGMVEAIRMKIIR
jgi:hypothetical protein